MTAKIIGMALLATVATSACTNSNVREEQKPNLQMNTKSYQLLGKRARLTYANFQAEVNYKSENSLHWKTIDSKGKIAESDEKVSYKQLSSSQFFVNWIEKDGTTVSQVVDMEKGKVTVYLSFPDDKSPRGGRSSDFFEGKWAEIKED